MNNRNLSIDIFRGLTMALMVFVNDLFTIVDAPSWMEHTSTHTDGMGLADIVFPMFLFAMGMSVPYALENRIAKGKPLGETIVHILERTFALLVMGVMLYNTEREMVMDEGVYWLLMLLGVGLVWNSYPENYRPQRWLRLVGTAILIGLVITYRTEDGDLFRAGWWGILGEIGWAYLFTAAVYLLGRKKPWTLAVLWAGLCLVNASVMRMKGGEAWIGKNIMADFAEALHLGRGSSAIMSLGGVLTVLAGQRLRSGKLFIGLAAAAVLAGLGMFTHQYWIISKNLATLPWCLFVLAISVALYSILRAFERKGWTGWAKPLKPAGVATLTMYMVPYFYYAIRHLVRHVFDLDTPEWLCGYVGVGKCVLFVVLCLLTTWALNKKGIKLKV